MELPANVHVSSHAPRMLCASPPMLTWLGSLFAVAVFAADLFNEPWGATWGRAAAAAQGSDRGGVAPDDTEDDGTDGGKSDGRGDGAGNSGDHAAGERDWTAAAASLGAAVGAMCPRWLIFVEGVGTASGEEASAPCGIHVSSVDCVGSPSHPAQPWFNCLPALSADLGV